MSKRSQNKRGRKSSNFRSSIHRKSTATERRDSALSAPSTPLTAEDVREWKYGSQDLLTDVASVSDGSGKHRSLHGFNWRTSQEVQTRKPVYRYWIPRNQPLLGVVGKHRTIQQTINKHYTLMVVGDAGVGKGALVHRFLSDEFKIGDKSWKISNFNLYKSGEMCKIKLTPYFSGNLDQNIDGVLYVYDITLPESLHFVKKHKRLIEQKLGKINMPCILVGNKADISFRERLFEPEWTHRYFLSKLNKPCADIIKEFFYVTDFHVPPHVSIDLARQWGCCFYEVACSDYSCLTDDVFYQLVNTIQRDSKEINKQKYCFFCFS